MIKGGIPDLFAPILKVLALACGNHCHAARNFDVKVSTFDPVRFCGVAGVIDSISSAASRRPDGTTVFKLRLRLVAQSVGPEAMNMRLIPGITVTADIVGGEKTALQYLLKPDPAAFERAMREY